MKLEDMRQNAREGKPIDLDRDAAERLSHRLRVYADTRKWFKSNITPAIYMAGI